jgi:hypothetical protein
VSDVRYESERVGGEGRTGQDGIELAEVGEAPGELEREGVERVGKVGERVEVMCRLLRLLDGREVVGRTHRC